jgi:threonylcarbamoyladenosine tRNA methylthiotransferase MtaB
MNRHYTTSEYARLIQLARDCVPDLAITTDLIAGFPGETQDEFAESVEFVGQMGFARAHVFPYSERPGTLAAAMPAQVDVTVRRARARRLRTISGEGGLAFRLRFVGQTLPVLWEGRGADGVWSGLTDNYIRVFTRSSADLSGRLLETKLCQIKRNAMWGELV